MSPLRPQPLPAVEPAEAALDLVFIEGFVGQTVIGIHHDELHDTQPVRIDLYAGLPRPRACDTDRIADTLDYSQLRARLQRHLKEHRLHLLEAFAESVAEIALREFGAHWVRVVVAKPRKFDDVEAVGVAIERHAAQATPGAAVRPLHGPA